MYTPVLYTKNNFLLLTQTSGTVKVFSKENLLKQLTHSVKTVELLRSTKQVHFFIKKKKNKKSLFKL